MTKRIPFMVILDVSFLILVIIIDPPNETHYRHYHSTVDETCVDKKVDVSMINKIQPMETKHHLNYCVHHPSSFHTETDSSSLTNTSEEVIIADLRIILS